MQQALASQKNEVSFAIKTLGARVLLEDVGVHTRVYDIVTCFNVIEHVLDPLQFLDHLVSCTRPGGYIIITTPNPGCLRARLRGHRRWERIDPPHHINLFTRRSLAAMAASRTLDTIYYGTFSSYITFVKRKHILLRKMIMRLVRLGNLGTDHLLILRKKQLM
jgi:2-polyprenyl-3-methyl-5-hydroxy-6-metoxy-1,4-benzoquinol methylase